MGAEDFSLTCCSRDQGAYLFLGQGDGAGLHHPKYNFNDDIAPVGASFFAQDRVEKVAAGWGTFRDGRTMKWHWKTQKIMVDEAFTQRGPHEGLSL